MNEVIHTPAIHLELVEGDPMADSRDVARAFGKQHYHVLRDIRELECSDDFRRSNFGFREEKQALSSGGASRSRYALMTRDGFMFLVMGFTGAKAARIKEAFIAEFNRMQSEIERLRSGSAGPSMEEVGEMIASALAAFRNEIVSEVSLYAVEKATMHEKGDFIRYVTAKDVCEMAGVNPRGKRGLTQRVSTALRRSNVPHRYDQESDGGPAYKFEPTAARAWARSEVGRSFIKTTAASYEKPKGNRDHLTVVPFQPPLPDLE